MSNENLDITKLIKEIEAVLTEKVSPLIRDIKEKRAKIPALNDKISEKIRDLNEKLRKKEEEERAVTEKKESPAPEKAEPTPAPKAE